MYRKPNSILDFLQIQDNQNAFLPIWFQPNDALFRFRHSLAAGAGWAGLSARTMLPPPASTTSLFSENNLDFTQNLLVSQNCFIFTIYLRR